MRDLSPLLPTLYPVATAVLLVKLAALGAQDGLLGAALFTSCLFNQHKSSSHGAW